MKNIALSILIIFTAIISVSAQWTNNPLENTVVNNLSGSQVIPNIAYDEAGNFYVGFFSNDFGNYNMRLQYYTFDGVAQWSTGGIIVSDHNQYGWLTDWDMTTDNNGNCILAFNDARNGNADVNVYAISPSEEFLWGDDGITLSTATDDEFVPSVTVTSLNNVIVAWTRYTDSEYEIIMQKITPEGTLAWGTSGITYQSGFEGYTGARVLGVDDDNYLMGFYKETGVFPALVRHIYVQKFDESGNAMWLTDVLVSNANGISAFNNFNIASDNANGIILAWTDDRDSDMNIDGAVQRVLSDGTILWPANGSEVSTANNYSHQNVQILGINSNDEVLVSWSKKNSNQDQTAIAGQKFSVLGVQQWTTGGIEFIPMNSFISGTVGGAVFDGTKAMIIYDEFVAGSFYYSNIKALAVDDSGNMIWTPTTTLMAARTTQKVHIVNSSIFNDQLIITWEESGEDIYMQNVFIDGSMGSMPVSNDATLSNLTINGETIFDFSPNTYYYEVDVPEGQTIPYIDATANNIFASIEITQASAIPGDGIIIVTAEDGTTELTYSVHFNLITGINITKKIQISVYPNPVVNELYFLGLDDDVQIDIYNLMGKKVMTATNNKDQAIETNFLNEGIYFAIIHQAKDEAISVKFIKK